MYYEIQEGQSFDLPTLQRELVAAIGEGAWHISSHGDTAIEFVGAPGNSFSPEATILAHFNAAASRAAVIALAQAKVDRATTVEAITVTVGDKVFDGDEISQNRMARAIVALQAANVATTYWTLANNVSMEVTVTELATALILAGQAQTAVWAIS